MMCARLWHIKQYVRRQVPDLILVYKAVKHRLGVALTIVEYLY